MRKLHPPCLGVDVWYHTAEAEVCWLLLFMFEAMEHDAGFTAKMCAAGLRLHLFQVRTGVMMVQAEGYAALMSGVSATVARGLFYGGVLPHGACRCTSPWCMTCCLPLRAAGQSFCSWVCAVKQWLGGVAAFRRCLCLGSCYDALQHVLFAWLQGLYRRPQKRLANIRGQELFGVVV